MHPCTENFGQKFRCYSYLYSMTCDTRFCNFEMTKIDTHIIPSNSNNFNVVAERTPIPWTLMHSAICFINLTLESSECQDQVLNFHFKCFNVVHFSKQTIWKTNFSLNYVCISLSVLKDMYFLFICLLKNTIWIVKII